MIDEGFHFEINSKVSEAISNKNIFIVCSKWNSEITELLLSNCLATLKKIHFPNNNIKILQVPGAFELVFGAAKGIKNSNADVVICLGCLIKGDTKHDEFIANSVAIGLQQLMLNTNTPCVFGVITTNIKQQAIDRANGNHGNKGKDAALTAIEMLSLEVIK